VKIDIKIIAIKGDSMEKKYISLIITILITIFIFSMSLSTGTTSGEMSSGVTAFIKNILDSVFVNNNITLESLHIFTRKAAHVFEYFILGISYYFTAKAFNLSILKVSFIALITAGVDEWIQYFVTTLLYLIKVKLFKLGIIKNY
jgi:VanZ family protein